TAPAFVEDLPMDMTVECDAVPMAMTLTATDNCGSAEVSYKETRTDGNCPSNYTLVRVWTAEDEWKHNCSQTNQKIQQRSSNVDSRM
ncbi:hypothetical protein H9X57_16560, partial [Flavobacterium piscinae]|uniref:hypothetical protein n=1 Tax=Flavobacterium piscinae TaxID=2506424 RepID=UPI0019CC0045